MSNTLYIMMDNSGSMNELGKRYIAANLIRYVRDVQLLQPQRFDAFNIRLFVCNETITEIPLAQSEDFVLPTPSGNFRVEQILSELANYVLILTDRSFEKNILLQFEQKIDSRFAFVSVGVDAKITPNKKKTNWDAFYGIDISAALDFLLISANTISPVNSIEEILLHNNIEDNSDDDWG